MHSIWICLQCLSPFHVSILSTYPFHISSSSQFCISIRRNSNVQSVFTPFFDRVDIEICPDTQQDDTERVVVDDFAEPWLQISLTVPENLRVRLINNTINNRLDRYVS